MSDNQPDSSRAATDVPEFIGELDGGVFERLLSIALSEVGAAVVDHDKKGEVAIKFAIERIDGTHQVRIGHQLKYSKPTSIGRSSEEADGATVLHVGRYGRLSLAQPSLLEKDRQVKFPD